MKERKKVFFSYSYLLATVTTHPATFSTSSKQCSRGDRFPAPSPFLLLDNCNRGGESQWRSYLLRVSVRRVRIEGAISLLERNTGSQRILRTATVITTSDNPGRCPGGGEGRRESLKTFASRPRDCEWKLTSVSLFLSLSLLYALNGANLVREEERKREKETRRKGEKPRERGQRKRMKKKKKFRRFLFFFSYISLFNLGVP